MIEKNTLGDDNTVSARINVSYEDRDSDRVAPYAAALALRLSRGWNVRLNGEEVSICAVDAEFISFVPYIEDDELLDKRPGCVRSTLGWDAVRSLHIY